MSAEWTGRTVDGRYRVEGTLGQGSAAVVYDAYDQQLERPVAVKLLRPEGVQDPRATADFLREAQLAAGLHHPHLAQVYDAGTADGVPYMVMERVHGAPLTPGAPLDGGRVVDLGIQVAGALAFVHEHGLIHCDVKPGNLLADPAGQVKLVDFGVACAQDDRTAAPAGGAPDRVTLRLPAVHASPDAIPYLAPERLAGGPPVPAADIYSLGVVLYGLLAGRLAYPGTTPEAVVAAQRAGAPPLRELNPAVPPALAAIIEHAIAIDPLRRFQSAAELQAALEGVQAQSREATAAFGGVLPAALGAMLSAGAATSPAAPTAPVAVAGAPIRPFVPDVSVLGSAPTTLSAVPVAGAPVRPFVPDAIPPGVADATPAAALGAVAPVGTYRPARPVVARSAPALGRGLTRWTLPAVAVVLLLGLLGAVAALSGRGKAPGPAVSVPVAAAPISATLAPPPTVPGPTPTVTTSAATAATLPAPDLVGLYLNQARAAAQQGQWQLVEAPAVYNPSVLAGRILVQQPDAGTPIAPGSPVTVTASLGPAPGPPAVAPAPAPVRVPPAPAPHSGNGHGGGKHKGKGK